MKRIRRLLTKFSDALFIVRVKGESLWPALVPGRRYLASGLIRPRAGSYAVFRDPRDSDRVLVKRVKACEDGAYIMTSAVSWGASSADFGPVSRDHIIGTLLYGT